MRRVLLRGAPALLLSGLAGIGSLWADELVPVQVQPQSQPPQGGQIIVIEAEKARAWAMLIELELLGDPATFPYALKAQANARGMEIQGYVPNTVVRDRALSLARQVCPMTVADGMVVQRNMGLPMPAKAADDLEDVVYDKVTQVCPEVHPVVEINEHGQVTLTGACPSLRDKLECSRALRRVTGVTSVKNMLNAADASMAAVGPTTQAIYVPESSAKLIQQTGASMTGAAPAGGSASVDLGQNVQVLQRPQAAQPRPSLLQKLTGRPMKGNAPAPANTNMPTPAMQPTQAMQPSMPMNQGELPRQVVNAPPSSNSSVRTSIVPPAPVTPARGTLSREIAEREAASRTEEIRTVAARQAQPAREAPSQATEPAASQADKTSAKPSAVPSARAQGTLKSRIRAACGPQARNVELHFDGNGGLTIVLHLAKDADVNQTINRVIQVPELANYELKMDFKME